MFVAERIAIIGAGVSGLTCGVVFAERGYRIAIFAKDIGQQTTSSVAAAVWFPYHVEPAERVIPLALETYKVLARSRSVSRKRCFDGRIAAVFAHRRN